MKLNHEHRTCETSEGMLAEKLSIEANAKMFKILSDGLYTNKELAVVRELLSNAWDAHVMAGTEDTPIQVHLPTPLKPCFEVKDFGTGLPPEQIRPLFLTYGGSNKTHTDDQIGGFGLGCKSPLALTDQFTVESRYNGTRYLYQIYYTADGTPACSQLAGEPTTELNGMTINVPQTSGDDYRWRVAYERIAPFIPTTPQANHEIETEDYFIDLAVDDHPHITRVALTLASTQYRGQALLINGITPYQGAVQTDPAHPYRSSTDTWSPGASKLYSSRNTVLIWTKIGTLPLAVSREGFEMTGDAPRRMNDILKYAFELANTTLVEKASEARTWFEYATLRKHSAVGDAEVDDLHPDIQKVLRHGEGPQGNSLHPGYIRAAFLTLTDRPAQISSLPRRAKNVALSTQSLLSLNDLEASGNKIYVRPKTGFRAYLQGAHENDHDRVRRIILYGDPATIRAQLKKAGIPCEVIEIPYTKPVRNATPRIGGATLYRAARLFDRCRQELGGSFNLTAQDTADILSKNSDAVCVISTPKLGLPPEHLRALLEHRVLRTKFSEQIFHVEINHGHARVRQRLIEAFPGRAILEEDFLKQRISKRRVELILSARSSTANGPPLIGDPTTLHGLTKAPGLEALQQISTLDGYAQKLRLHREHHAKLHRYLPYQLINGASSFYTDAFEALEARYEQPRDELNENYPGLLDGLTAGTFQVSTIREALLRTITHLITKEDNNNAVHPDQLDLDFFPRREADLAA